MDEKSIKAITDEVTEILIRKNQDYGGASFDLGLSGNMVHLWDKVKRYRNLIENPEKEINFESLSDTLKDIIGYAIIGLHLMKNDSITNKFLRDTNLDRNE